MNTIELRLLGRYRLLSASPKTHESLVYFGQHSLSEEPLFIKGQGPSTRKPQLTIMQEGKVLQSVQGGPGIPRMYWCGPQGEYNFLVLEQYLHPVPPTAHSLKTALMVGIHLVDILQYLHFKHYVFNNLCPNNVMLSITNQICLVDYSRVTKEHEQEKKLQHNQYNRCFSSIHFMLGLRTSQRDDMESLLYLMAHMIQRTLPWQLATFQQTRQLKTNATPIFQHKQLQKMLKYTLNLAFNQKPNYNLYKKVFEELLILNGETNDQVYDWILEETQDIAQEDQHYLNERINLMPDTESNQDVLVMKFRSEKRMNKSEKGCFIY